MADSAHLLSDGQLLAQARAGSDEAWEALLARHRDAVTAVAREVHGRRGPAAADAAFDTLRAAAADDLVGAEASTEFAIRAVRPGALALVTGGTYAPRPAHVTDERGEAGSGDGVESTASLSSLATAFGRLSSVWQTVLWHRLVEGEPAAAVTGPVGRIPNEVVAVEAAATRGLFENYLRVELETDGRVEPRCRRVVALLGAQAAGTLSDAERRAVESHLQSTARATGGLPPADTGCDACRRRLDLRDQFDTVLPAAVVPGLTGLTVDRYRTILGVAPAFGTAALAAQRSERANQRARVAAVAAVVVALLVGAFLIRSPFGDLEGQIADLFERASTTTTAPQPDDDDDDGDGDGDDGNGSDALPSRIELVFPGVPQGIVYVPGGVAVMVDLELSVVAPMYRGATGTIDVTLTNQSDEVRTIEFVARTSPGVSFDTLAEGPGTCAAQGAGATCTIRLNAGVRRSLALRFAFDETVSDRLVVAPNISSQVLDLPIETVADLVLAQVSRGGLALTAGEFGPSDAVSGSLALPDASAIDRAVLVWTGAPPGPDGSSSVEITPPGGAPVRVASPPTDDAGSTATRASAEVTDLVRVAGAGTYTVRRAPGADGDGSWALLVVTADPTAPRRLIVAVDTTTRPLGADDALALTIPIGAPVTGPPPTARVRPTVVRVAPADVVLTGAVNGVPLRPVGEAGAYALDIDADDDALEVDVIPTNERRVAVIGFTIDIVS
ncbi:MAG TPA: zf-HC2 domain-containing protein [Ilumatobacteraceae bacterium]|nr:zf-HC2 domain-containing protein [Ilumatobacteraceae bacterium]